MDKILVSIIIPVYQQEKWIGRCLQSVLNSSHQNLDIIVVNDGSTDETEKIVQEHIERTKANRWPEIRLINIFHGGPACARNAGLREAKGQFIGFLDADDMVDSQMIERLVRGMLKGNDLTACGLKICDRNGKPARWQYPLQAQRRQCPVDALELVMWEQILMSVSPALFRREKILNEQGELLVKFPEEIDDFEDFVFISRYLSRCEGIMEVIPFYGALYCKRAGSLTTEIHTIHELCQAMHLILEIGEQTGNKELTAHKLQYAFRFVAFWYKEALRCKKKDFSPDCESWKICMEEIERFADLFISAKNVSCYKKIAMQIIRKHAELGRILVKIVGRLIFNNVSFGMMSQLGRSKNYL